MKYKYLSKNQRWRILLAAAGIFFFIPFNGAIHLFDWDEINFAESAREMIVSGDYSTVTINFIPFWEKPPLFIWMQAISMKIFGINEFAARFPNAICGIITFLLLFEAGLRLKDYKLGLFWALAYGASMLPFLYFKSGIIDPWFNLFIFSSLFMAFRWIQLRSHKKNAVLHAFFSGLLLGMAVLTKGPAALLLFGLSFVIYLVIDEKLRFLRWSDVFSFGITCIITGAAYHIYQAMLGNWQLLADFFNYQMRLLKTEDAGHGGFFLYHPVVLFFGVFPSSVIALKAFYTKDTIVNQGFRKLMLILFFTVLIIFTIVKTKIVHYSSLAYFPLTYLAAITMYQCYVKNQNFRPYITFTAIALLTIYSVFPFIIQWIGTHGNYIASLKLIKDDFAVACLQTPVTWSGFEFLAGITLLAAALILLFKKSLLHQILVMYIATIVFVSATLLMIVPRIEKYSQGPAIEFISRYKDKPVWISTMGYKSYAHLFYSNRLKGTVGQGENEKEYLLNNNIDREVYFIIKTNHINPTLQRYPQLELIDKKGGFALLKKINTSKYDQ